jgi:hypothetical protein
VTEIPTDDLRAILSDLSGAQVALRASGQAFDDAVASMGEVLAAIRTANHAQGEAIDRVISATTRALALFNGDGGHH